MLIKHINTCITVKCGWPGVGGTHNRFEACVMWLIQGMQYNIHAPAMLCMRECVCYVRARIRRMRLLLLLGGIVRASAVPNNITLSQTNNQHKLNDLSLLLLLLRLLLCFVFRGCGYTFGEPASVDAVACSGSFKFGFVTLPHTYSMATFTPVA